MKKLWLGILATLLVVVFVAPSFAWEFSMTGDFEFRYRYFGRADGSKDLFGDMNFQNSPNNASGQVIGFAGPNFYRGYNGRPTATVNGVPGMSESMNTAWNGSQIRIVKGGFSYAESDAFANDQRMTFVPSIRVNNAIRLHGTIDLAGIRQRYNHRDFQTNGPLDRWYQDRLSFNGTDTAMIPSISQWRLTTQLPWGVLSIGAKDFPFGTGSLLGYNTRASAFLLVLPYGPFRFLPSIWLGRGLNDGYGQFQPYQEAQLPANVLAGRTTGGPAVSSVADYDGGERHQIQWSVVATYENGPITLGGGFVHQLDHKDRVYPTIAAVNLDIDVLLWNMWMKYNNGRFFANAEYNFVNQNNRLFNVAEQHIEAAQAFAELGALCGPAKVAGIFAWSSGPALNNNNRTKSYRGLAINNQATDAYNYLLFHTYGGGNNAPWDGTNLVTFTNDENGMMSDAYALAARLDYAAAANLNLWGSYMWAHRVEQNGFYGGGVSQFGTGGNNTVARAQLWKSTYIPGAGAPANMNPFVDDGYLGWEAGLGVDWKLLENFSVKSRYAYWQPGPWFNQAYQVVGISNGVASTALGYNTPIAAGGDDNFTGAFLEGRSAIQAFECSVVVDF